MRVVASSLVATFDTDAERQITLTPEWEVFDHGKQIREIKQIGGLILANYFMTDEGVIKLSDYYRSCVDTHEKMTSIDGRNFSKIDRVENPKRNNAIFSNPLGNISGPKKLLGGRLFSFRANPTKRSFILSLKESFGDEEAIEELVRSGLSGESGNNGLMIDNCLRHLTSLGVIGGLGFTDKSRPQIGDVRSEINERINTSMVRTTNRSNRRGVNGR